MKRYLLLLLVFNLSHTEQIYYNAEQFKNRTIAGKLIQEQRDHLQKKIHKSELDGDIYRYNQLQKKKDELDIIRIRFLEVMQLIANGIGKSHNVNRVPNYVNRNYPKNYATNISNEVYSHFNTLFQRKKYEFEMSLLHSWIKAFRSI